MSYFKFEAEFVDSLHCIPMIVRMKLDTCGVKLKLNHWNQFNLDERENLVNLPCESEEEIASYRESLQNLVFHYTEQQAGELSIDPHPPWLNPQKIPLEVQEKAKAFSHTLTPEQWANLSPQQRFALIKLSRSSHENRNFYPALQEFNLV